MGALRRRVFRVLGAALAAGGLAIVGTCALMVWQVRTITSVSAYPELLERWDARSAAHFPARVPEHATLARVSYFPGFMQGGAHLQLRVRLPTADVFAEQQRFAESAVRVYAGGRRPFDFVDEDPESGVPLPALRAAEEFSETFPSDFTIYVLAAQPGTTAGFPWNHGRTSGVAVSAQRSELVYWAERW